MLARGCVKAQGWFEARPLGISAKVFKSSSAAARSCSGVRPAASTKANF
jgi:hypothetical protein